MKFIHAVSASFLTLAAGTAMAYPAEWGSDITIYDKNTDISEFYSDPENVEKYWYYSGDKDKRIDQNGVKTREDQEVEPGMLVDQKWDAEGFFQNGTELTFVGGFDYVNGVWDNGEFFGAGDLFIDINGDADFGNIHRAAGGDLETDNNYGYEYVFDIDWANGTYDVYNMKPDSTTIMADVRQNEGSSPWQYDASDNNDTLITSGAFSVTEYTEAEILGYF